MPTRLPAILAKIALQYRNPEREFRLRLWPAGRRGYRASLRARDSGFRAHLQLRAHSDDLLIFEQVFLQRYYDFRLLGRQRQLGRIYERLARGGDPLILDLGANIGLASLYFAKNFPRAHLLAVEPSPDNCRQLRQHLGGLPNVEVIEAAVASLDGAVRIANPGPEHSAAYRTEPARAGESGCITAYSIPTLLQRNSGSRPWLPFLVKIDIEGAEAELFSGNVEWLRQFPVLVLEPHDWMLPGKASSRNWLRALQPLDRDFLLLGESIVSIAPEFDDGAR